MKETYAIIAGLDWADQQHVVCWREVETGALHTETVCQRPEALHEWIHGWVERYPGRRIAIGLEQKRGALVNALFEHPEVDVYPVNPATLAKYREAFCPSGAKDDPSDAALLLDLLERHRDKLSGWAPETEATRLLRLLCEARRKLVNQRTALCQSLQAQLKAYYPQALLLVADALYSELSCAFLMKWPRFEAVAQASAQELRRFYYSQGSRSEAKIQERLATIAASRPLTTDEPVVEAGMRWVKTVVRQIRQLNRAITEYERRIEAVAARHPDVEVFASFPGAGKALAPRLVGVFGTDRARYESAADVATLKGVAPVMERSGKSVTVRWRRACPKFDRQTLVEFAEHSVGFSRWARVYYQEQRRRGKTHQAAIRALAFKWTRILYRCWQNQTAYDEARYLAALQRHGSWIATALKNETASP